MKKRSPKTEEEKEAARASRIKAAAERERAERKKNLEIVERRRNQLTVAKSAEERLRMALRDIRRREKARENLTDHVDGFYDEIDKLAKGKSMLEATNLVVAETNQIIRDAKALVVDDPYLDRVKEFVPAGENPVYPDVVVSVRSVRQALSRAEARFAALQEATEETHGEADTIRAALDLFVEQHTYASKRDVLDALAPSDVVETWFVATGAGTHFDYDRLDDIDLAAALSVEASEL